MSLYSERQISLIAESGRIIACCLDAAREQIKPGVTTRQIDTLVHDIILREGGQPAFLGYRYGEHDPFPASICASVNDVIIHGLPDDVPLKEGDLFSLDVGVLKDNYHADAAWTFCVGQPDDAAKKMMEVGEASLAAALCALKPRLDLAVVGQTIQPMVESAGFSVIRDFVGHGVGHKLHEPPQIHNYVDPTRPSVGMLKNGMVVAIEPMIAEKGWETKHEDKKWPVLTKDGGRSVHFEHTIAMIGDEVKILTK